MRILLITLRAPEINSSVSISNIGLLKGLNLLGHDVFLVTPQVSEDLVPFDPIKVLLEKVKIIRIGKNRVYEKLVSKKSKKIKKKIIDVVRFIYYKVSLYDNTINLIKRADISLLENNNYDIVLSTSDPKTSHLFTNKLISQGLQYKCWIQHWGDPLFNDITRNSWLPSFFFKIKEKEIINRADAIIYVSPITLKMQKKLFKSYENKMHFVPLPYSSEKNYKMKNENNKVTIGYFGDYNSKTRNILPLYEFCEKNINFELIIAGSTDLKLSEKDNIKIYPRLSQNQIAELEEKCDIFAVVCNRKGTQIPGKVYYYSGTNLPILLLLDGFFKEEIGKYFEQYNRFLLCNNSTSEINKFFEELPTQKKEMTPCDSFSYKTVSNEILKIASQC